jgi:tRNA (guanine-N7-)-methyltransferase
LIEFRRTFYKDSELPFLWHYIPEFSRVELQSLFETRAEKFILEIGSGKGAFLCQYALNFPQYCILGAEWNVYCANLTAKKIAKLGLKNAAVMRGDLFYFLRDLVPIASIDEAHIYFPDPWPKRRHQKNRLILREGFLETLCRVLKPGKRMLYWATDHEEYNKYALETFRNFPGAKILEENTAEPTYGIETGFEKKYKKEQRKIYRSVIQLNAAITVNPQIVSKPSFSKTVQKSGCQP